MKNPDWNLQVTIGEGQRDPGAQHRAIDVARQLLIAEYWPGHQATRMVIHHPRQLHHYLHLSGPPERVGHVNVYPGVHDLAEGQDYEVRPLPADFWAMNNLEEPS